MPGTRTARHCAALRACSHRLPEIWRAPDTDVLIVANSQSLFTDVVGDVHDRSTTGLDFE